MWSCCRRCCQHTQMQPCLKTQGSTDTAPGELASLGANPANQMCACEGNCDTDANCLGHLKCFQRDKSAPVPGCDGGEGLDVNAPPSML